MFIVLLSNIVNGSNHTKSVSLSNQKDELEVVILSMTYLIKYVFQIKQRRFKSKCVQNDYRNK